jgi:acetolactate synthase-1/2/3 large subunit
MKLADALLWALEIWDVRYVFGVSGANVEHLHDAIVRSNGKVVSVLAKSEVGAAFMADARARAHHTLGVCCATSGGGMMNLAVGLAESHAEHVPVLAIVGQVPSTLEGRGAFQDSSAIGRTVDALGLFRSISKYAARVDRADAFWETLETAAREALSGVPGPAVLLIPRDAYELEVPPPPETFPRRLAPLSKPAGLDSAAVRALMEHIRRAKRPVLVVGREAETPGCRAALVELAASARIPVATTMGSPAAFPNDHPLYLGCVGAAGHPSAHAYLNEQADLVIAIGAELDVMTRQPWARGLERARVVAVSGDTEQVGQNVKLTLAVRGAPDAVLQALVELHALRPFLHDYEQEPLRRYVPVLAPSPREEACLPDALLQSEAIALLEGEMPSRGHVLFDAGNCAAASIHGMRLPREAVGIIALGMGGMGYAIAGAIGAQLGARAGERTVVLCGDGAFLMLGFEVHTAVELRLPILFVVFNNAKHGMCVTRQQLYFEGRVDCTEYSRVDIAKMSRGMGTSERLWVGRASTRGDLVAALAEFRASADGPGVLELVIKQEEMPPFAPFLRTDSPTYVASPPSGVHCAA